MQDQSPPLLLIHSQNPELVTSPKKNLAPLPEIPDKIYFTIGEASRLCLVKPYILRYWEEEFPQLTPDKRRGNRRYYNRNEIILIRKIKSLLYEDGFTVEGAKSKLNSEAKNALTIDQTSYTKLLKDTIEQLDGIIEKLE